MNSWLGWTTITRAELASAQQASQLADHGVRDEIGVSAVHFLYAERFFPGTSVQLTRLRYIFFVAALYESLRWKSVPINMDETVAQAERRTAFQLRAWHESKKIELEGSGIIGRTVIDLHAPVVLPSMSYWTPLTRWGILAPSDAGSQVPSRAAVHADWDCYRRRPGHCGEVDTRAALFTAELESHWKDGLSDDLKAVGDGKRPLPFGLTSWERTFLKRQLSSLHAAAHGSPPLIACLAARSDDSELVAVSCAEAPWSARVIESLSPNHPDHNTLRRARHAAHLVQIGCAIYDLLVARLIRDRDGASRGERWASQAEDHLQALCEPSSTAFRLASSLDLEALRRDATEAFTPLDNGLVLLLHKTQEWLNAGSRDPMLLAELMRTREIAKKTKSRARLVSDARERRKDWKFSPAKPLDYRWSVVTRLLSDLAGIAE